MGRLTIAELQKKKSFLDTMLFMVLFTGFMTIIIGIFIHWVLLFLIICIVALFLQQDAYKKLNLEFKKIHVKKMIESIIPGLTFVPEQGFEAEFVFKSNILRKFTKYKSEDYLAGCINGKSFESADVLITEVVSTGKTTTEIIRFLGRLFVVDFDKKFEHDVYISTDGNHTPAIKSELTKVKTESIEFNKKFKIYSESEHSAFYLLTPRFMEHIEKFSKVAKHVMFAFKNQKAYIAVYTERDTFNVKFSDTIDENYIENVRVELKLLEDLIDFVP